MASDFSVIASSSGGTRGLISDGAGGVFTTDQVTAIATGSTSALAITGAIALGTALWTAIGFVTYARRAVRDIFGIPPDRRSYFLLKARDLLAAAGFSLLNPHAYLDCVVFLGTLANQQGGDLRWVFAAGAFLAGTVWFSLIGFGGKALRGLFAKPGAWRVLDGVIAVMMFVLAAGLIRG